MRSARLGKSTSAVEVTNISQHGFWLLVDGQEHFLPFGEYPWFRDARISEIQNVRLEGREHLYWEKLDVDLSLDILRNPARYPLIAKP